MNTNKPKKVVLKRRRPVVALSHDATTRMEKALGEMKIAPLTTVPAVCEALGIGRESLYDAIRLNKLKAHRIGGHRGSFRILRADLAAFLARYPAR